MAKHQKTKPQPDDRVWIYHYKEEPKVIIRGDYHLYEDAGWTFSPAGAKPVIERKKKKLKKEKEEIPEKEEEETSEGEDDDFFE